MGNTISIILHNHATLNGVTILTHRHRTRGQLKILNRSQSRKSQHIFAKQIKKFQTQAAKAVEKTASADRKPRISRG